MSGKCRPCLRIKTLANLDRASRAGYISMTDYNCIRAVFEKLEEYEKQKKVRKQKMNCNDCIHFNACYKMAMANNSDEFDAMQAEDCENFSERSLWVKLPSEDYIFTIRGDLARGIIIANCRAAEEAKRALEMKN